jgi:hypothetical protein
MSAPPLALIDELLDDHHLRARLWRAQASADLTDDDHDIAFSGWEVTEAHNVIEWAMRTYPKLNGGATLSIIWFPKLRRASTRTRARFANETQARNSEPAADA